VGANFSTLAFIVVVLGGLSSVPGAIAGGLFIGVIESLAVYFLGSAFQQAAYFLLFILVLIFKPNGLFGRS
jgi:branched-chain amino acid transport system permease protein